jgi:multidrug resistance efflux pump
MAFIDPSQIIVGAEIAQIDARYIKVGQPVEITFKTFPGEVFTGKVETVLQAIATGQAQPGGLAVAPSEIHAAPFAVRIALDDQDIAKRLPAGSAGVAAIFTDRVKASHMIRQVVLRQTAILNYVNPL